MNWRDGKTLMADIAAAEVLADDGRGNLMLVEVGVPCLIHKEAGVVWTSHEAVPPTPVGVKLGRYQLTRLSRAMSEWWPEAHEVTDWTILSV